MLSRVAITTALLVPMVAAPVAAQNYRWDFGVNGGYSWYSGMLGSEQTGLPDGTDRDDVKFEAGWLFGTQLGYWMRPKLGLRLNATYSERPVVAENYDLLDPDTRDDNWFSDVNLWSGSLDLLFRFRAPNETWQGRETLPYLALGVGGKWHNPGNDAFICQDAQENKEWSCFPWTNSAGAVRGNSFALGEQKVLMGLVGLGADIRMSPGFALRLEASDRIYKPQIHAAGATSIATTPGTVQLPNGDDNVSQVVHELAAQLGLHLLFGLARPEVVTVAPPAPPPPPPPPPAQPRPEPPPAPRVENVSICVVDPTAPGGLRMQMAQYRVEQRDTVINGTPFRTAIGTGVMTARNADWYVTGKPLTLTIGSNKIEYMTEGGARNIEASRLAFLGYVNGYPVYADRDEVADVIDRVNDVRRAQAANADLGRILAERKDIRDELEDIKYLYVPLETTGCIFQPVLMMEQVRKGKQ